MAETYETLRKKKLRKKLIERMKDGSDDKQIFVVTEEAIANWFEALNTVVFRGQIRLGFRRTEIRRKHRVWAEFTCRNSYESPSIPETPDGIGFTSTLVVLPKFPNERAFINILGHEMVHLYQFECEHPSFSHTGNKINHGKSFWKWKPTFEKYGLTLQRVPKL